MYAIIAEGSKQFKVSAGDTIRIDRAIDEGTKQVTLDRVLLVGGTGEATKVGGPTVAGATVTADVLGEVKGPKVRSVKYKRRKGFTKTVGHRQHYTALRITAING